MKKRSTISLLAIIGMLAVCGLLLPIAIDVYSSLNAYNARIAASSDYTKITTPLSNETVTDLCEKFAIDGEDQRCRANAIVYGPDFFPDIKNYFRGLPGNEATYELAQNKLSSYLIGCEAPDNQGNYVCRYDIRGDGIYPISIFYSQEDRIYQIFADTSGS